MALDYIPWNPRQLFLLPRDPSEWLGSTHLAPMLLDVVEQFDLHEFYVEGMDNRGAPGFDPKLLVIAVLYCLLNRQTSARSMERYLLNDIGGRYLCGDGRVPGWRCIAAFRQRFRRALANLFTQSVRLCSEADLVDLSTVFGDGSKLEAFASKRSNVWHGDIDNTVSKLQKAFEELLLEADRLDEEEGKADEADQLRCKAQSATDRKARILAAKKRIEEEAQAAKQTWDNTPKDKRPHKKKPTGDAGPKDRSNLTDPESRLMKFKDGVCRQGYNVQLSVEGSNQIIVGATLSDDCTDPRQLPPLMEHVKETTGTYPVCACFDAGYVSQDNLDYLDKHQIDPVIAVIKRPQGDAAPATETANQTQDGKQKRIKPYSAPELRMLEKLEREEVKTIYSKRKQVVEPVFGQLKGSPGNPGLTGFTVRGLEHCQQVIRTTCAVHNIRKYIKNKMVARKTQDQIPKVRTNVHNLGVRSVQMTLAQAV